jgi:hypothetical protein
MTTSHFHTEPRPWPRGKAVRYRTDHAFPGEYVYCQLDLQNAYWPLGAQIPLFDAHAHERRAHVEYLQMKSPEDLLRFVRQWGPLSLDINNWKTEESLIPSNRYWGWQHHLRRLVNLFAAVRNGLDEARYLGEFLQHKNELITFWVVHAKWYGTHKPDFVAWLERGQGGEIVSMLQAAPVRYVRQLMDLTIADSARLTGTLATRRQGRRGTIYPRLVAENLMRALECMIILDEWSQHPLQICAECTKLFRVETRHERRYCSPECSRRVSARECKRKQRSQQRKNKSKGRTSS